MNIRYFLERRLKFVEQFYREASAPFVERKRKIDAKEEPFVGNSSEDGEPPFLFEWLEAEDSLQVLGKSCLSMLSASLHLYLKTWECQLGRPVDESLKPIFKKKGWFAGYQLYFSKIFSIEFEDSGCSLALLEELVLARNRVQHPDQITTHDTHWTDSDLQKLPSPVFVSRQEVELNSSLDSGEYSWLLPLTIHVTPEKLNTVISEIRRFAEWLETADH
ncbi:hypothetical protein [Rhodoferax saidenbachensis]|uniref:RiboL-PSP-HEPN domain-containing protein n=1 Tax=Rhodoferax saidenbachensis TaxID=1484693 RepID=A0ABU1ZQQ8_9BURK|nr:hypothetical protein [Rhodoferax saidenbachensis]MDR7307195.1 hypothetical protein [Rhodoferax saidenbachensis]